MATTASKECRELVTLILRIHGALGEDTAMTRPEVTAHYLARIKDHGGSLERALRAARLEHGMLVELGLAQ